MQNPHFILVPSLLLFLLIVIDVRSLPTSLIEDVKSNEPRASKIKRGHGLAEDEMIVMDDDDQRQSVPYYNNPTAIKRGITYKNAADDDDRADKEWYRDGVVDVAQLPSSLFTDDVTARTNDKSMAEYEKGFRYGTNKDKLNEALENAVLKSELYGEPMAVNRYRYYGTGMEERRRKRNTRKSKLDARMKREVIDFSPEDVLTLLTLWESEQRQRNNNNPSASQLIRGNTHFNNDWQRFNSPASSSMYDFDSSAIDANDIDDENWLDAPVYPHVSNENSRMSNPNSYYYEDGKSFNGKRPTAGQWDADYKRKRFMVARKRNDPTRELHYLTGGQQQQQQQDRNDFYTLSQLLSQQREPDLPVYHRLVL